MPSLDQSDQSQSRRRFTQPRPELGKLFDRLPPHALEAEMSLLGSMLLDPSVVADILGMIRKPEDFYLEAHGAIFRAIIDVYDAHHSGDLVQIVDGKRNIGLPLHHSQCGVLEGGIGLIARAELATQQGVTDMTTRERPVMLGVALHGKHPAGHHGVVSTLQMVLIDTGIGTPTLHHPYMGEVISQTQQHHIHRHVKVGWPGRAGGVGLRGGWRL